MLFDGGPDCSEDSLWRFSDLVTGIVIELLRSIFWKINNVAG